MSAPIDIARMAISGWCLDEGEEVVFDQPCAFGERAGSHAVYCTNDAWAEGPRKCRRTWYTGGEVRDEDCEGYKPNPVIAAHWRPYEPCKEEA